MEERDEGDQSGARHPGPPPDDRQSPAPPPAVDSGPAWVDPDPDPDWTEYTAWVDQEIAAGRDPQPEIWVPEDDGPIDPLTLYPEGAEEEAAYLEEAEYPEGTEPLEFSGLRSAEPPVPGERASAAPGAGPEPSGVEPSVTVRPFFGQGGAGDQLPPGPVLAGLTDNAATNLTSMSDDELVGVLQATRRQVAHEQYKQVLVTAEFARRRQAAFTDAARQGVPVGCRPGGFPGDELAIEMVTTLIDAGHKIDDAIDLTSRLPRTLAGMAAGLIDADRAGWIAFYTRSLSAADVAYADEILADAAPDLRVEQLARKAAALEKKLNPGAVKARRERARRSQQRVEVRPELSGNASLSGREMDTADVLASKAHIDAIAAKLRRGGLPGPLGSLRVLAMADLTQGRDPLDRLHGTGSAASDPVDPVDPAAPQPSGPAPRQPPGPAAPQPAASRPSGVGAAQPLPALICMTVPVGTLLGSSTAPAWASGWGLIDHDEARTIAEAAARHPRTRWCATLTAPDGTALAHACATGQHPRLLHDLPPRPHSDQEPPPAPATPGAEPPGGAPPGGVPSGGVPSGGVPSGGVPSGGAPSGGAPSGGVPSGGAPSGGAPSGGAPSGGALPGSALPGGAPREGALPGGAPPKDGPLRDRPPHAQPPSAGQVTELLQRLGLVFTPIARSSCDHAQAETGYTPSRKLRHLVRARNATCDAPGCGAEAIHADLDHTQAWPEGPTDECNLAPRCRTHHRAKQAPDWTVEQIAPGTTRWTLPSGRTHTTTATQYDD